MSAYQNHDCNICKVQYLSQTERKIVCVKCKLIFNSSCPLFRQMADFNQIENWICFYCNLCIFCKKFDSDKQLIPCTVMGCQMKAHLHCLNIRISEKRFDKIRKTFREDLQKNNKYWEAKRGIPLYTIDNWICVSCTKIKYSSIKAQDINLSDNSRANYVQILHLNMRSMAAPEKFDRIKYFLTEGNGMNGCTQCTKNQSCKETNICKLNVDIFAVSETWLTSSKNSDDYEIQGYALHRKDRQTKITEGPKKDETQQGGGIAFYLRKDYNATVLEFPEETQNIEILISSVTNETTEFYIILIYSPTPNNSNLPSKLKRVFGYCTKNKLHPVFLLGDINVDVSTDPTKTKTSIETEVQAVFAKNNFFQLIDGVTNKNRDKCIDVIYTNAGNANNSIRGVVNGARYLFFGTDHALVYVNFNCEDLKKTANVDELTDELGGINLESTASKCNLHCSSF